ncbi:MULTISPECIES: MipA/OmpV family protein [unclassified Variovorax]|uniref:MipA/OmpV family protein n=1 Tax=unclassified Variovorax TaxID=663243 RepID=UPI000B827ABC|nr:MULTISPECIES: MipA/OmpV family protein [unclassified Variovorax]
MHLPKRHLASYVTLSLSSVFALGIFHPVAAQTLDAPEAESRWGLGLAVGSRQSMYAGKKRDTVGGPLISYENRWVRVLGPGLEVKLPSIELGPRSSFNFGLVANYDQTGYEADDSPTLAGMAKRKGGVWLGANAGWRTDLVDLKVTWTGASGNSKGQKIRLGAEKSFSTGSFVFVPRLSVTWLDKKYVDYYYGVRAEEATVTRPTYLGQATVATEIGLRSTYLINPHHSVFMDVSMTAMGKEIKNSPLVDRSNQTQVLVGYSYRF